MKIKYKNSETKERLDHFLVNELKLSRTKITNLINDGLVLVNDKKVKTGYILLLNDEITINQEQQSTKTNVLNPIDFPLDIAYEDEYLMIVNKPNNLLVHPTSFDEDKTLANYVKAYFIKQGIKFNDDDLR